MNPTTLAGPDGFFPPPTPRHRHPAGPEDVRDANAFRSAVVRRNVGKTKWRESDWAQQIRNTKVRLGEERFRRVFAFHLDHIADVSHPWAWCPKTFDAKFERIEQHMRLDAEKNPAPVAVTPDAERVARQVRQSTALPPAADAELDQAVQKSLDAVRAFTERLRAAAGTSRDARRAVAAGGAFGDPREAVKTWVLARLDNLKRWEDWDGTLHRWAVWHPGHKHAHVIAPGADWESLREAAT